MIDCHVLSLHKRVRARASIQSTELCFLYPVCIKVIRGMHFYINELIVALLTFQSVLTVKKCRCRCCKERNELMS